MTMEPDPRFDALHPSGQVMFRSCRGGYLHSIVLGDAALDFGADDLADAVLLTARVSHLRAVMDVRQEIIDSGFTPSPELAAPEDLAAAEVQLVNHRGRNRPRARHDRV
jgi:hypothetical protein